MRLLGTKILFSLILSAFLANSFVFNVQANQGKRKYENSLECDSGKRRRTGELLDIVQFQVLSQKNNECGYHAFYNAVCLSRPKKGGLNNSSTLQRFLKLAKQKILKKREIDKQKAEKANQTAELGLSGESVPCDDQNLSGGDIEFLQKDEDIRRFFCDNFNLILNDKIDAIRIIEFPCDYEMGVGVEEDARQGIIDRIEQIILEFKYDENNEIQILVIRYGNHWIAVELIKNNPLSFLVADSLNQDQTNNQYLKKIFNFYVNEQNGSQWFNSDGQTDYEDFLNNAFALNKRKTKSGPSATCQSQENNESNERSFNTEKEIIEKAFKKLIFDYDFKYQGSDLKKMYSKKPGKAMYGIAYILNKEKQNEDSGQEMEIDLNKFKQEAIVPEDEHYNYKWEILIVYYDGIISGLKSGFKKDNNNMIKDFFLKYLKDICLDEEQYKKEATFFEEYNRRTDHQMTSQEKTLAGKLFDYLEERYIKREQGSCYYTLKAQGIDQARKRFNKNPEEFVCMLKNPSKYQSLIDSLDSTQSDNSVDLSNIILYDKEAYDKLLRGETKFSEGTLLIGVDLRNVNLDRTVVLMHSILIGANFKGNKHLNNLNLQHSDLSYAIFDECKGTYLYLNEANLTDTSFIKSCLAKCNFNSAILINNKFDHGWLYKCRFGGDSKIKNFSFDYCKIQECSFSRIQFDEGTFFGAEIFSSAQDYKFINCIFDNVNFTSIKMNCVYFENCFFSTLFGYRDFSSAIIGELIGCLAINKVAAPVTGFLVKGAADKAAYSLVKHSAGNIMVKVFEKQVAKGISEELARKAAIKVGKSIISKNFGYNVAKFVGKNIIPGLSWLSWGYDGYKACKTGYNVYYGYNHKCTGLSDIGYIEMCCIYNDRASWYDFHGLASSYWYDISGLSSDARKNLKDMGMTIVSSRDQVNEMLAKFSNNWAISFITNNLAIRFFGI